MTRHHQSGTIANVTLFSRSRHHLSTRKYNSPFIPVNESKPALSVPLKYKAMWLPEPWQHCQQLFSLNGILSHGGAADVYVYFPVVVCLLGGGEISFRGKKSHESNMGVVIKTVEMEATIVGVEKNLWWTNGIICLHNLHEEGHYEKVKEFGEANFNSIGLYLLCV
ncbi:hypothetical protein Tco_0560715 [Tanacetum coccineum]